MSQPQASVQAQLQAEMHEMADADLGPYHVVLAVMVQQFAAHAHGPGSQGADPAEDAEAREAEERLRDLLLRLLQGGGRVWQPTMRELLQLILAELPDSQLGASLEEELLHFLGEMNHPEDLLRFAGECLEPMTQPPPPAEAGEAAGTAGLLDSRTELGRYVRQICLAIRSIPFEAQCLLLEDLQSYGRGLAGSPAASSGAPPPPPPPLRPRRQHRVALEEHVDRLIAAASGQAGSQLGGAELEARVSELEAAAPDLPRVHMLRHAAALSQRDHVTAVDSLHRCFDHWDDPGAGAEGGELQHSFFPEALLNLGAAHAHFGHTKRAMLALNETVRVAQQLSDDGCLQHALAQLCRLLSSTSPAAAAAAAGTPPAEHWLTLHRLLLRCELRSRELELPHLEAYARLALAQFRWQHGGGPPDGPETAAPGVARPDGLAAVDAAAAGLQLLHNAAAATAATPRPPADSRHLPPAAGLGASDLYLSQAPVFSPELSGFEEAAAEAVAQACGTAQLLRAAAWADAGDRAASQAASLAFLRCHARAASADDRCLAHAQLAHSLAEARGPAAAAQAIAAAEAQFPDGGSRVWAAARLSMEHGAALRAGRLALAERLAQDAVAAAGPVPSLHEAIRAEGGRLLVEAWVAQRRFEQAEAAARALFAACAENGLQAEAARVLLALARLHRAADAPANALPYAIASQRRFQQLGHGLAAAEAQLHVAALHRQLRSKTRAQCLALALPLLPLLLANGSLAQQALLHGTLAELLLQDMPPAAFAAPATDVSRARQHLAEAARLHEALADAGQAADCHGLLAALAERLGDGAGRDAAAAAWQRCEAQAASAAA